MCVCMGGGDSSKGGSIKTRVRIFFRQIFRGVVDDDYFGLWAR